MTYATAYYVLDRWVGSGKPDSDALVQLWLDEAELLLFSDPQLSDLDARLRSEPGGTLDNLVILVESRMVMRALKNPDNLRQISDTKDVFAQSKTFATESFIGLEVTASDRELLSATPGSRAGTIPTLPAEADPNPLCGVVVNGPLGTEPGQL